MTGPTLIVFYAALGLLVGVMLTRANMCMMRVAHAISEGHLTEVAPVLTVFATGAAVVLAADHFGLHHPAPWTMPTLQTVFGAVLIGLGARLNFACSIGTMGRLFHGDIGALATVAGALVPLLLLPHAQLPQERPEWAETAQTQWVIVIAIAAVGLLVLARRNGRVERLGTAVVLGASTALLYGWWTQVRWGDMIPGVSVSTSVALFTGVVVVSAIAGAVAAAHLSGRLRLSLPRRERLLPEFLGGALIGAGAHFVPGATDTLAFHGVPSGSPHAIIAWLVMFVTIVLSFRIVPIGAFEGHRIASAPGHELAMANAVPASKEA